MRVWIAILACLLIAPVAAQDVGFQNPMAPTPITMYVHLNGFQDAPINTQRPSDAYAASDDIGLIQHSQGCQDLPSTTLVSEPQHTSYAFSSPSLVQYDVDDGGKPTFHNERGISYDLLLDPEPVELVWYLETQVTSGSSDSGPEPNQLPILVPQVVMRGTIREGDAISVGAEAYNAGELVAEGFSTAADLSPLLEGHEHVTYMGTVDEKHLFEFRFPLEVDRSTIRAGEGYNLRVDIYMDNPACNAPADDQYVMPDFVRHHTSPGHRPTFTWTVMNPIRIESLHPQAIGDDLIVHGHMNSVFGNYDVWGDSYDTDTKPLLDIQGPSVPIRQTVLTWGEHFNHGPTEHVKPIAAAWEWPTVQELSLIHI